jgi:hypothetical protein
MGVHHPQPYENEESASKNKMAFITHQAPKLPPNPP